MISEFKVSVCIIKTGETYTICKFEITNPLSMLPDSLIVTSQLTISHQVHQTNAALYWWLYDVQWWLYILTYMKPYERSCDLILNIIMVENNSSKLVLPASMYLYAYASPL